MKFFKYVLSLQLILFSTFAQAQAKEDEITREQRADKIYGELFTAKRGDSPTDPEFMEILQRLIFGEVFDIGELDHQERELITVVSLTTMQTLPQLKAHINAALNVGNTPLQVRESIYLAAPFIGFPRTLNAVDVFNEVMKERDISLPLENSATINEENRFEKGLELQRKLYGDEVKQAMQSLPKPYQAEVPDMLTKFCFSDFYTRKALTLQQKELLSLVILTTLGAEKQIPAHIVGNLKVGNDRNKLLAAMIQAIPYIGLPNALTTINLIKEAKIENYKPIYE